MMKFPVKLFVRVGILPHLEAERQAYALYYHNQAKLSKEIGGRFLNDEIPETFEELRSFVSPLGSRYGPLSAQQTRNREHFEKILNGENDLKEAEEVAEWERRSLAEYEENSRAAKKKLLKRKKAIDQDQMLSLRLAASLRHGSLLARRSSSFLTRSYKAPNRCLTLAFRFVPLAATYPLASRVDTLRELWWTCVLLAIQSSGPTFIKLGQWASTRRDIFSKGFCDRMSILHTKTRSQRHFRDCDNVLDEVFGYGFAESHKKDVFIHIEPYSIGSGCIAQVYKATVNVPALEIATGRRYPQLSGSVERDIAIKVAERGVEEKINLDLSILRNFASLMVKILPSLGYLEPLAALSQFEMVLRRQVDLRNEARALQKFAENFDHKKTGIKFPVVIGYTKNAIVETFEHGMYINRLVSEEDDPQLAARQSPRVRRRIALLGARALLKMIFVDNFVHGDLHPGNILIRFNEDHEQLPGVHNAPPKETIIERCKEYVRDLIGWRAKPRVRLTDSPELADEPTLIMLDTGIVVSETEKNLRNLKALFKAIIEKQGYKAGELLLTHADNSRNCRDPHEFCLQVDKLVSKAMKERSLRSLNISALLSEMFSLVAAHRVYLDSSFTSVVLSVMVLEGFGRSLDPDLDLFQCARPYLLNMV
ncbi:ABC1 family protein [Necator americanus]|uniref:ABC1 family protein n=1 Tax=Necator americanus TaxID=51031 RepID=W2SGE2_NECAM|nr:ABC1 family protein [Necator americanus]ETN68694.1 ABC1 family protein [Necator americanus]